MTDQKQGLTLAELRQLAEQVSADALMRAAARALAAGTITQDEYDTAHEWAIAKADAV